MPQHRSAKTGRKVSPEFASQNKDTTIRESKSKDTKRLDWLQKQEPAAHLYRTTDGWWRLEWSIGKDEVNSVSDATPRKCIDAAMKAEKVK